MVFSTKLLIGSILCVLALIAIIAFYEKKHRREVNLRYKIFIYVLTMLIIPLVMSIPQGIVEKQVQSIDKSEVWTDNITAQDEAVMIESGYKDLDNYYVRIVETELEMETGRLSGHFQRINADGGTQRETYRYIEMINKEKAHAPIFINLTDTSEKCILTLKNSEDCYFNYADFYAMRDDKSARYYYYKPENSDSIPQYKAVQELIETADTEDHFDSLEFSQLCEKVYMPRVDADKSSEGLHLRIYIASELKLPEGALDSKWSREFIGMRNYKSQDYKGTPEHLYCYLQEGEIGDDEDVKIPLLDKKSIDGALLGEKVSEICLFNYVPKNGNYTYQASTYALGSDIMRPMYVYKCEEK